MVNAEKSYEGVTNFTEGVKVLPKLYDLVVRNQERQPEEMARTIC